MNKDEISILFSGEVNFAKVNGCRRNVTPLVAHNNRDGTYGIGIKFLNDENMEEYAGLFWLWESQDPKLLYKVVKLLENISDFDENNKLNELLIFSCQYACFGENFTDVVSKELVNEIISRIGSKKYHEILNTPPNPDFIDKLERYFGIKGGKPRIPTFEEAMAFTNKVLPLVRLGYLDGDFTLEDVAVLLTKHKK